MLIHIVVKQNQKGKTFQFAYSYKESIEHSEVILNSMISQLTKQAGTMTHVEKKK